MQIPKSFKLGNRQYTVHFTQAMPGRGHMGEVDYALRKVTIARTSNMTGRSFKSEEIDDTFWHEVTHAILKDMGHKLWDNERFVTRFAQRLTEVINTAKL